jgi:uroporphyrinogen III methyltransferase/synthase
LHMAENLKGRGIVYLIGAGPGHPGLITRLGFELLQHCDAVAYDALIPMELIAGLPDRVERHYVGKRAGKHSLPQSKINELLMQLAQRGLNVVRLKGGDPFIFGRSGEEAEYLAAAGIPVVIIPGVTAASAAAAMSGFSLTNRHFASWVFLATGHGAESASIPVPWDQVAALPGGTLVIYMGLARLDQLVGQLLSSGLAPETPAMVIQAASTGIQKSVEAPLARLNSECRRSGLRPPALIVIGDAVQCRTDVLPAGNLAGKRILVTSPRYSAIRFCELLRNQGAESIPYPTVRSVPVDDTEGWARCLQSIESEGMCLFSDDFVVHCFFDGLLARGLDVRSLHKMKILAWGDAARAALIEHGIKADEVIDPFNSSDLGRGTFRLDATELLPLIWVRGDSVNSSLESGLHQLCRDILPLIVCANSTAAWEAHWGHELIDNPPDYICFTGVAEVEALFELLGDDMARHLAGESCLAAQDGPVAEALLRHGLPVEVNANAQDINAFVSALVRHSHEQNSESLISRVC